MTDYLDEIQARADAAIADIGSGWQAEEGTAEDDAQVWASTPYRRWVASVVDTDEELVRPVNPVLDFIANAERDVPRLVSFARAVLALTYASDDGSEFEHSEGCDGQSECGGCWAADLRRVANQHLGGAR